MSWTPDGYVVSAMFYDITYQSITAFTQLSLKFWLLFY